MILSPEQDAIFDEWLDFTSNEFPLPLKPNAPEWIKKAREFSLKKQWRSFFALLKEHNV